MTYDPCPCCGGDLEAMGGLGNNTFYRCQDCGLECYKPAPVPKRRRKKPTKRAVAYAKRMEDYYA